MPESIIFTERLTGPVQEAFTRAIDPVSAGPGRSGVIKLRGGRLLIRAGIPPDTLRLQLSRALPDAVVSELVIEPNRILSAAPFTAAFVPDDTGWALPELGIRGPGQPTGKGAVVAILDSGMDFGHPDFPSVREREAGRIVDDDPQDGHGHGTHCAGIVGGPLAPQCRIRYGVAPDARLLIANVYEGGPWSNDWNMLRGLLWAAEHGAHVASISIGKTPEEDDTRHSLIFEIIARYLLEVYGMVIVAAAGNSSDRKYGFIGPIDHPADCPSIVAVGAVNKSREPARFSSGGAPHQKALGVVAPGVSIVSSYPRALRVGSEPYEALSGTSQAAPHVAAVAALWVEKGYTGGRLLRRLLDSVNVIPGFGPRDVGAGLVQAPAR